MNLKERSLKIQSTNTDDFNFGKVQEELLELSLALTQLETKKFTSKPVTKKDIIEEVGDVQRMLWYLIDKFKIKKEVKQRIRNKVSHLEKKKKLC